MLSRYMCSTGKWWPFCCITAVSAGSATRGENTACILLQLPPQLGENAVMAAASARREYMCLQFLQLLESSSSLLDHTLPTSEQCK